jgi:hypothetical protein
MYTRYSYNTHRALQKLRHFSLSISPYFKGTFYRSPEPAHVPERKNQDLNEGCWPSSNLMK